MPLCPNSCGRVSGPTYSEGDCRLCWLTKYDRRYARKVLALNFDCSRRGEKLGKIRRDGSPGDTGCGCVETFACETKGKCTLVPWVQGISSCYDGKSGCPDYVKKGSGKVEPKSLTWNYAVTTVPSRRADGTLARTLASLAAAGFDRPHLFVDGEPDSKRWTDEFGERVTCRWPAARTAANWVLSLYEMWCRDSQADRYAIFQDDFVTCLGLREYLESCSYAEKSYYNLYTFPNNQRLAPRTEAGGTADGWFRSNQLGKGAVALVFDRAAVLALLSHPYLPERFLSVDENPLTGGRRCDRSIDGGVVECLKRQGFTEWCHSPSLTQHTGIESSMGNRRHALAESFRGEGWDARSLIAPSRTE